MLLFSIMNQPDASSRHGLRCYPRRLPRYARHHRTAQSGREQRKREEYEPESPIGIKLRGSDKQSSFWHHEEKIQVIKHDCQKEWLKMSVTQVMEQYQSILEEETYDIAYITGAGKRKGKLDVVTLAQMMILGFWQDPDLRLSGLAQIGGRREVHVTESAISQRFTPECAMMFLKIMQRLAEVELESEKVDIPLLKQFSAVIVEGSISIAFPS